MTDIIPISTVAEAASAPPPAPKRNDQLDKDAFLRLLVAQLKYQNPLSPSDPNQFMAQTAQFTMVEKLEQMAQDAARSRAVTESMTATGMLGREITWIDAAGDAHSGVVTATSFGTAGATLHVGDERVPLERVSGVRAAPAPAADPETTAAPAAPAADQAESTDGSATTDGTDAVAPTDTDPTDQTTTQEA